MLSNVMSFIEGNTKFYKDMYFDSPTHIKEQVKYRLSICDDCVEANACVYCKCPPAKKAFVNKSCNGGDRFPNLMSESEWNKYKEENNIKIDS